MRRDVQPFIKGCKEVLDFALGFYDLISTVNSIVVSILYLVNKRSSISFKVWTRPCSAPILIPFSLRLITSVLSPLRAMPRPALLRNMRNLLKLFRKETSVSEVRCIVRSKNGGSVLILGDLGSLFLRVRLPFRSKAFCLVNNTE